MKVGGCGTLSSTFVSVTDVRWSSLYCLKKINQDRQWHTWLQNSRGSYSCIKENALTFFFCKRLLRYFLPSCKCKDTWAQSRVQSRRHKPEVGLRRRGRVVAHPWTVLITRLRTPHNETDQNSSRWRRWWCHDRRSLLLLLPWSQETWWVCGCLSPLNTSCCFLLLTSL